MLEKIQSENVSAIIPCYNCESYISLAIESLLHQSVKPLEIIVVDDGSSDGSAKIASSFPVRILTHESNKGLAEARNTGIREAIGSIVVFLDSDCEAYRQNIEVILSDFNEKGVASVGGQEYTGDKNTICDRFRLLYLRQNLGDVKRNDIYSLPGLCFAFRREIIINEGLFGAAFRTSGEDTDATMRLKAKGYKLIYDPAVRVHHHRSDNVRSFVRTVYRWTYYGIMAGRSNYGVASKRKAETGKRPWIKKRLRDFLHIMKLGKKEANFAVKLYFIVLLLLTSIVSEIGRIKCSRSLFGFR